MALAEGFRKAAVQSLLEATAKGTRVEVVGERGSLPSCQLRSSVAPLFCTATTLLVAAPVTIALNLPGWRWGTIMKIPLVAVSRPLHSGVCETRQDAGLPVIHSAISDRGCLRTRGN